MMRKGTIRDFVKMHGLGNDFVVFDSRDDGACLDAEQVRMVADRKMGIGCDQLITLLPDDNADAFMRIQNADGSEVDACGNASRCVASLLMDENGTDEATLQTNAGRLVCTRVPGNNTVTVDMGIPNFDWQAIPLAEEMNTIEGSYEHGPLSAPGFANVGNPHAVFFVDDASAISLDTVGPTIETDALFPERINVEVAQIIAPDHIRMRVWERGVGITRACGTGACGTLVAAVRRGLADRKATVQLDGGYLLVEWADNDHILMSGDAVTSFRGKIEL